MRTTRSNSKSQRQNPPRKDKKVAKAADVIRSAPGNKLPQETVPVEEEETHGCDWEDGDVHLQNSKEDIVVEFDQTPSPSTSTSTSSAKKKRLPRPSAHDKELAELAHKAHLLCLLARGRLVDAACNDPLIQSALLSLLPAHLRKIAEAPKVSIGELASLVHWFHGNFHVGTPGSPHGSFKSSLGSALENGRGTAEEVAALSVALFRALNLTARFVSILDVVSLKPDAGTSGTSNHDATGMKTGIFGSSTLMVTPPTQFSASPLQFSSRKLVFEDDTIHESFHKGKYQIRERSNPGQSTNLPIAAQLSDCRLNSSASTVSKENSDAGLTKKAEGSKRKGDQEFERQVEMALAATASGVDNRNLNSEMKDLPSSSSYLSLPLNRFKRIKTAESPVTPQGISTAVGSSKAGPPLHWAEVFCDRVNLTGKWVHVDAVNAIVNGADKVEAATAACKMTMRYVVAFAGFGVKDVTRRYCMKWYKIASQRVNSQWWDGVLAPLAEVESGATGGMVPLSVPQEYASDELEKVQALTISGSAEASATGTDKTAIQGPLLDHARLSTKLGSEVPKHHDANNCLQSSTSTAFTRNSLEDIEMQTKALTEPLPTNQEAYRKHNLYAIERFLSRYEIFRPKGPILGYCSGHPVYPRTCVQTLQTRQRWLREGLQIKENEAPSKMLKRSGKAQASEPGTCGEDDDDGNIPLYGKWQTEPLNLPHAINGIVPRNERGQVDVWSEKCLPPGTVHLRFPRIVPVAKRLEVDFAPAMVGFEFRNGRSFPVYEGIVVCSEFKDAVMEAYAEVEEKREAEEKKQNEAQALSRWYQLLSSIITRQRLKDTYGDGSTSETPYSLNRKDGACGSQINSHGDYMVAQEQPSKSNAKQFTEVHEHEHTFPLEDQSFDEESSVRTKRCPCGFLIQVEEL